MYSNYFKEIIHTADFRQLIPPPRNHTMSDGRQISNFNLSPELMEQEGWREWSAEELAEWHEKWDLPEPPRQKCTKYQLLVCLRTHYGVLYTALMAILTEPSEEQKTAVAYWNAVQDLDRNNEDFKAIQAALGITDEQLDAIFAKIDGEEPNEA